MKEKEIIFTDSSRLITESLARAGADVFITSEFNHHFYQEAAYYINIVDATHHSTEQFAKIGLKEYLKKVIGGSVSVFYSETDTDVVISLKQLK